MSSLYVDGQGSSGLLPAASDDAALVGGEEGCGM